MQRDTFNEWHRDTGLVASLDYQEVTLGGRPVTDRTPNSAKTVRIPYLNFRYSPELAKEPVSTRIGAKLINIFKGKHNNLNVTYDPVRQLLLIEQSASLYVSPMPGSPKSKILISDADFFSIDTVPIGLIHEHGHHKVKTSERPDDSAQSSRSFRHVFGEARVNQSSEVFHSVYLKGSGGQFPRLNFEEIYTFWISAKSALFNLKQRLQTPDTSIKEISSALDELKYSVRHLRAISLDARYLYDEVDALLKRPNSVINIRRSGDKLFLVTSIYPSRSQSKYLKVPPDQIPSSLKIDVEIPIELEPPSLWILRFMEIEGRAPSTTGLSPLPNEFRADFEKGMSERIAYLQNRLAGAVKTGDNLEGFLRENPEPTREQLEALVKIL
ncbi:MAG TPA: hypothetical protein VM901_06340 [Bdellovibrionota bacterium]|nr:hypothetical protein [Bdellovibrionota bacterium]